MDFRITEEQELMVQAIEEAMTRENLEPYFQDCDKNHTHPEKWWEILKSSDALVCSYQKKLKEKTENQVAAKAQLQCSS